MAGEGRAEVERFQKLAAEQVAGDEAWRDGLEDEVATPLLDWALGATDRAIERLGASGQLNEDRAYETAAQARAVLTALGGHWRGQAPQEVDAALAPHLGPPLFDGRAAGAAAIAALRRERGIEGAQAPAGAPPAAPAPAPPAPAPAPPAAPARRPGLGLPQLALIGVIVLSLVGALLIFCRPRPEEAPPTTTAPAPGGPATNAVAAEWYEIYFTQPRYPDRPENHSGGIDERLVAFMGTAQRSLDVAIYDFDLQNVAEAMAGARGRGVAVRLVTDSDTLENKDPAIQRAIGIVRRASIPIVEDKRSPIMHHKFAVVDGQAVLTGSWNFTTGDTYRLNNNAVIMRLPQVAANFTGEFEKMFVQRKFGPNKAKGVPYPRVAVGDATVETHFASADDPSVRLREAILASRTRVDFLAFSFTHDALGQAVTQRGRAGARVRGVFENTGSETRYSEFGPFKAAGFEVYQDGNPYVMHHKVFVLDDRVTAFGSFNFSDSAANSNDENLVIVDDPRFAQTFMEEVERVVSQARNPVKGQSTPRERQRPG
ncbi:MAG TPA: phospholipase D-like domain-containing protein [Chloroflexota bacterium]|nr:phospholipase D-like domain-containing protein [Chloroflexota bacterium]